MKIWFSILLVLLTGFLFYTSVRTRRKKTVLWNLLWQMMVVVLSLDTFYFFSIFLPEGNGVLFFQGLYFSAYIWLLTAYLRFVNFYAEGRKVPKALRYMLFLLSFFDTVSLTVANVMYRHAFTVRTDVYSDGMSYHFFETNTLWYNLHQVLGYALALAIISLIAYRQYKAPSIYRVRYTLLMVLFIIMCVFEAFFIAIRLPLDMILIFFNLLVISVYYLISRFIPNDLTVRVLSYAASSLQDGIVCFDMTGTMLYANMVSRHYAGSENRDLIAERFLKICREKELDRLDALCWRETVTENGDDIYYQIMYQTIHDAGGAKIGFYFTIQDRTSEMDAIFAERFRSLHDPLTGLLNMDGFTERAEQLLTEDPDTPRFMLASNIKDFKLVNNLFGIEKGNEILRRTAALLRDFITDTEAVGRFGADRFVMLIPRERFREKNFMRGMDELASLIDSSSYRLCVHLGVFAIDDVKMTIPSMCDRANMALHSITNENRSMVVYFSEQLLQDSLRKKRILSEVEDAMRENDIAIYLQPQVDQTGQVLGAEALVRWIHPTRGVITPDHFIPVLEEAGMISKLDQMVWEYACKQLVAWKGTKMEPLYISVNISPRDFYYIDLYNTFTKLIEKYELNPQKLRLEITESALMLETEKQQALVKRLRAYGFEVEIDDFGSGYSSLSMLKDLPVDTLKIDRVFLLEVEDNLRSRTMLSSIVSLSHSMNMSVIAEGVENKPQMEFLLNLGCNCFQGYYFSRPLPVPEFEAYFSTKTE